MIEKEDEDMNPECSDQRISAGVTICYYPAVIDCQDKMGYLWTCRSVRRMGACPKGNTDRPHPEAK